VGIDRRHTAKPYTYAPAAQVQPYCAAVVEPPARRSDVHMAACNGAMLSDTYVRTLPSDGARAREVHCGGQTSCTRAPSAPKKISDQRPPTTAPVSRIRVRLYGRWGAPDDADHDLDYGRT
jgi:hypothetical protein